MKINAFEIKTKLQALMAEFPELADDEDLRLDTVEGETELFEVLAIIVDDIRAAVSMQQAIDLRIKDLKARKERYERREEGWRKLAKQLMDTCSFRKMVLPEATLNIRAGQSAVRIFDQAFLPDQYWRIRREPDLSIIKNALKAGIAVPGASLNNAPDVLAIVPR